MAPGKSGEPWALCVRCWLGGVNTRTAKPEPKRGPVVSAEMGDALAKSGWKVTDATDADYKRKRSRSTRGG